MIFEGVEVVVVVVVGVDKVVLMLVLFTLGKSNKLRVIKFVWGDKVVVVISSAAEEAEDDIKEDEGRPGVSSSSSSDFLISISSEFSKKGELVAGSSNSRGTLCVVKGS